MGLRCAFWPRPPHQGEIVSLGFRLKGGREAIPFLQKIGEGRCTFSGEYLEVSGAEARPPTAELFALLAGEEVPLPVPRRPASPAGDPARLERAQQLIGPGLAEFLGPMAAGSCREYLLKAASLSQPNDLRYVIEAIAKELRDPVKEARFKQQVLARLG